MNLAIINRLLAILNRKFLIRILSLNGRSRFYNDFGMNQWERMEMLVYIENEFNIDIDEREIDSLHTVNDLIACIKRHTNS